MAEEHPIAERLLASRFPPGRHLHSVLRTTDLSYRGFIDTRSDWGPPLDDDDRPAASVGWQSPLFASDRSNRALFYRRFADCRSDSQWSPQAIEDIYYSQQTSQEPARRNFSWQSLYSMVPISTFASCFLDGTFTDVLRLRQDVNDERGIRHSKVSIPLLKFRLESQLFAYFFMTRQLKGDLKLLQAKAMKYSHLLCMLIRPMRLGADNIPLHFSSFNVLPQKLNELKREDFDRLLRASLVYFGGENFRKYALSFLDSYNFLIQHDFDFELAMISPDGPGREDWKRTQVPPQDLEPLDPAERTALNRLFPHGYYKSNRVPIGSDYVLSPQTIVTTLEFLRVLHVWIERARKRLSAILPLYTRLFNVTDHLCHNVARLREQMQWFSVDGLRHRREEHARVGVPADAYPVPHERSRLCRKGHLAHICSIQYLHLDMSRVIPVSGIVRTYVDQSPPLYLGLLGDFHEDMGLDSHSEDLDEEGIFAEDRLQ